MKLKELLYLVAGILLTASLIPTFMSAAELDATAQISVQPTATFTPTPDPNVPTPTNTPVPPTPTNTPVPPTPTNTPVPPTPTDTPIPNAPPSVDSISAPLEPVSVDTDQPVDISATFGDADGASDAPYTCTIDYGDGTDPQEATVAGTTCSGSYTYAEAGVYGITVKVTDRRGEFGTGLFEFVVVYDPSGGFVSGGGWIDSPPGAYTPDPTLTGQATFGFVSRYRRGSSRPTGNTQFQFRVAALKFFSETYNWLVVNQDGSNAQFKGEGTINGAVAPTDKNYRFMIWATDGSPSDSADTFRIRIWYEFEDPALAEDIEIVVYDNGVAQDIGGGNITVHKPAK